MTPGAVNLYRRGRRSDPRVSRTAAREAGYEARAYGSAGEFLLDPLPDRSGCLLLDMRLPGPSGLELQAALSRRKVALPVIFLTGYADIASCVLGNEGRRGRLS